VPCSRSVRGCVKAIATSTSFAESRPLDTDDPNKNAKRTSSRACSVRPSREVRSSIVTTR
jgi:hypothetical protein